MNLEAPQARLSGRILSATVDGRYRGGWRGVRPRATHLWSVLLSLVVVAAWSPGPLSAAEITDANVVEMVGAAKTPEDHQALAAYFTAKAAQAGENAKMHETMLNSFQGGSKPQAAVLWKNHCNSLIRSFRSEQKDYQALAKEQETIASTLSGVHKGHVPQ